MKKCAKIILVLTLILGFPRGSWVRQAITKNVHTKTRLPGESIINIYIDRTNPWIASNILGLNFRDTTEILWDDGSPEAYYVITFPPGRYDRMAVRFSPPGPPPMKIVSGRFYADNSVIPLQSFSVCPDAGGYPDVFHPIDQIDTVYGGSPGWGNAEFQGAIFDSRDIWAVVHWIPGYVVGIGADSTAPDGNSYWCNEETALIWYRTMGIDWMLRLSVASADSHDVTAVAILEPPGRFFPGDTAHPTAVFGNCGLFAETFDVAFEILDSIGNIIYTSTDNITLASSAVETLTFAREWVGINEGMYTYKAYTSLTGDIDPANDTARVQGLCTREIIITYCGDYTNTGSAIIGTWASNRKYLVRMTPPIPPPFYLRRAEIFLTDAGAPMEYVCVCPDNGSGLPDTTVILAIANNVSASQTHTWVTAEFGEVAVTQPGDLWVIEKWPEGITEPHIGMEINVPSSERSWRYYFRNGAGHYENLGLDPYYREWYFRLIIAVPPLGIEEDVASKEKRSFGLCCKPNPGRGPISISYNVPRSSNVSLSICDITGRLVKTFSDIPGNLDNSAQSVSWDGTDDTGKKLPAGVYFVRLTTGFTEKTKEDFSDIKKAIILR